MRTIELTQGKVTKVDDSDFEWLSQWNWFAHHNPLNDTFSAVRTGPKNERIVMARLILGLERYDPRIADHINHDTLNNSRENLRIVNSMQSMRNRRVHKRNKSGFKGVMWKGAKNGRKGYWLAKINAGPKRFEKGGFKTPEEAHTWYCEKMKELHGEFGHA